MQSRATQNASKRTSESFAVDMLADLDACNTRQEILDRLKTWADNLRTVDVDPWTPVKDFEFNDGHSYLVAVPLWNDPDNGFFINVFTYFKGTWHESDEGPEWTGYPVMYVKRVPADPKQDGTHK